MNPDYGNDFSVHMSQFIKKKIKIYLKISFHMRTVRIDPLILRSDHTAIK